MTDESAGIRFHEAISGARQVISRIREDGLMKDTEFTRGFYQRCTRRATSEADKLEEYLDAIVLARFEDGPTSTQSGHDTTVTNEEANEEDPPF